MSITLEKVQQVAADELIAVTGDKTVKRTWDLAAAIAVASPRLDPHELNRIRQAAVVKAGHDQFWSVTRLRQMGRTAQDWPETMRVSDVSLDAHMEALRGAKSLQGARQVLLKVKSAHGEATIRQVRAELGKNGTKAQPPRIDKAGIDEIWRRLTPKAARADLKKHLRGRLKEDSVEIMAFADLFNELVGMMNKLSPQPQQSPAKSTKVDGETEKSPAPVQRRNRRKGL